MSRKPIPKPVRRQIYAKHNGHCAYCGCKLEYDEMQVDHIIPVYAETYYGGTKIEDADFVENYNPSCRACNFYKSTLTIEQFRSELGSIVERLKKVFIFRLALKYGLIKVTNNPITFYFERK